MSSSPEIYYAEDFTPSESLKSRYATKMVNGQFYGITIPVQSTETIEEQIKYKSELISLEDNLHDYPDRCKEIFAEIIALMIKKIKRDHCE